VLWDISRKIVRVTNRGLFCKNVIMCDMLWNDEITYRVRKFGMRVRWQS